MSGRSSGDWFHVGVYRYEGMDQVEYKTFWRELR